MIEIDVKGLACPAPVIQTRSIIEKEQPDAINIIVDNEAAVQNVSRFLQSQKYKVSFVAQGKDFLIEGIRNPNDAGEPAPGVKPKSDRQKIMIMVGSDKIGNGDDELGKKLMISFLKTLNEMGSDLWRLVFVNNGVKLTIQDAAVLSELKHLEETGIHILVCGTCLNHFNLLEQKQVGETTNMLDIITAMQLADKVINL